MVITLIGYRGSGKSRVAGPLADRLGWTAVDSDAEIERRAGQSIRDLFAEKGEPHFRQLERQVLAEWLAGDRLVIAAGGGAVLNAQTRRQMRDAGPVVWLTASVDTLAARIGNDATTSQRRPDLTSTGGREEVEHLLAQREPLYRQCAAVSVPTDERTIEDVVETVLALTEPMLRGEGQS